MKNIILLTILSFVGVFQTMATEPSNATKYYYKSATQVTLIAPSTHYYTSAQCTSNQDFIEYFYKTNESAYTSCSSSESSGVCLSTSKFTPSFIGSYPISIYAKKNTWRASGGCSTYISIGPYDTNVDYTLVVKNPAVSSSSITVCEGTSINLSNNITGDSGFTFKEGSTTLSATSWSPSVGTHTITATKSYENGTKTLNFTITVIDKPTTASTVTGVGSYCGAQTNLTLTASGSTSSNGTVKYYWYSASSGGTLLKSNSETYTVSPTATKSYYVETRATLNGVTCNQGTRKKATVTIIALPGVPTGVSNGGAYCGPQEVAMTASGGSNADSYVWYNSTPTKITWGLSTATLTDDTFTKDFADFGTPSTAEDYTYTVYSKSVDGCVSSSGKEVTVTIKPIPSKPVDQTTQFLCAYDAPGSITMQVSGDASATWEWSTKTDFSDNISTTNSFTANGLSSSKDYYVRQTVNGCASDYTTVTANVYPLPTVPTTVDGEVCISGKPTVSVSDITGSDYRWYLAETGGTKINGTSSTSYTPTSNLTSSRSYWFEYTDANGCDLENRVEVKAIVHSTAIEATVNDVHRCGPGNVSLPVTNAQPGYTYNWYELETGGGKLYTGTSYTTPSLSISKQYWVETLSNYGCTTNTGNRVLVTAYIESSPSPPGTVDQIHCQGGSFELQAAGTPVGGSYKWYDKDINFLADGLTYTTSNLSNTTDFYVKSVSQYNCVSTASLLKVTIVGDVVAPIANDKSICDHGSITLNATGGSVGDTYHWYDSDITAFSIADTPSYTTLDLNVTTSYWVEIETAEGCVSPRTEVQAIINPLPTLNIGSTVFLCTVGDTYDLTQDEGTTSGGTWSGTGVAAGKFYSSTSGSGEFQVTYDYTDPITGCSNSVNKLVSVAVITSVDAGEDVVVCQEYGYYDLYAQNFTPAGGLWTSTNAHLDAAIDNSGVTVDITGINPGVYEMIYTVGGSGCESTGSFNLTVNEKPVDVSYQEASVCGEGTVELQVLGATTGQYYNWYDSEMAISPFQTGASYVTPTITQSTTYYVSIENGNTGCEGNRAPITATVYPVPVIDAGNDLQFCDANATRDLTNDASILNGVWSGSGVSGNSWSATGLAEGDHIITYTYTTADGCTAVDDRIFSIGLDGGLVVTADNYTIGSPINFESSFEPSSIVSIDWFFGDSWTSGEIKPIHSYFEPGIFDVGYTVNLDNGCVGTFSFSDAVTIEGETVDIITGVKDLEEAKELSVFPTYVQNHLTLNYYSSKGETLSIKVVSPQGILVSEIEHLMSKGKNTISLDDILSKIPQGMNFIIINNEALKIIKK